MRARVHSIGSPAKPSPPSLLPSARFIVIDLFELFRMHPQPARRGGKKLPNLFCMMDCICGGRRPAQRLHHSIVYIYNIIDINVCADKNLISNFTRKYLN